MEQTEHDIPSGNMDIAFYHVIVSARKHHTKQQYLFYLITELASMKNSPSQLASSLDKVSRAHTTKSKSASSINVSPLAVSHTSIGIPKTNDPPLCNTNEQTVVNMDPNILSIEKVASPELLITKLVMDASKQLEDNKLASFSAASISLSPHQGLGRGRSKYVT